MFLSTHGIIQSIEQGSNWTPASLPGLVAWYRSDLVTLNGSNVSTWDDKTGNSYHLLQSTPTAQPAFSSSIINGHSVISFDGNNDLLKTNPFTLNQPTTAVILFQLNGTPFSNFGNLHDGNGGNTLSIELNSPAANSNWYAYAGAFLATKNITVPDWHLSIVTFNGVNSAWYLDSEAVTIGNGGALNAGGLTLGAYAGGSFYAWYKTPECFILNTTVDSTDVSNIKSYINTRYNLSYI